MNKEKNIKVIKFITFYKFLITVDIMHRLKELRKEKGWKQSDLTEKSGVNLSTIQKIESGVNDITKAQFCTLYPLAKAFGVSIEYLVGVSNVR